MGLDIVSSALDFGGKIIDRIWPDPAQAEAAKIKLAEMAQNGELAQMANRTELFKAEVDDRKSARDRDASVATSDAAPMLNKVVTPALAIGVVVLSFVLFGVLAFGEDLPPSRKDIVIYILGVLSAAVTQVLAFYFGSSTGSSQTRSFLEDHFKNGR